MPGFRSVIINPVELDPLETDPPEDAKSKLGNILKTLQIIVVGRYVVKTTIFLYNFRYPNRLNNVLLF